MVFTTAYLSEIAASRDRCSQILRSGERAGVGLKGPRIFSGAVGFMSKLSNWLGPPKRNMKMTDLARGFRVGAACSAASRLGRLSPNSPAPPARRISRRLKGWVLF